MKFRKLLSLFIAAAAVISMTVPAAASFDDPEEPVEPAGTPYFALYENQRFEVEAGEINNICAHFSNMSKTFVKKAYLTIDADTSLGLQGNNVRLYNSIEANSVSQLDMAFRVPDNTLAGTYPVKLTIEATNRDNETSSHSLTIDIIVKSTVIRNALTVSDFTVSKEGIKAGDVFDVTVKVKNGSGVAIKNGRVELEGLDGSKFAMNTGVPYVISDFKKDEEKTFTFSLIACAGISSIREAVSVNCTYYLNEADDKTKQESTGTIMIACEKTTGSDGKTFAPNIIIQSYDFGAEYAVGGKTFPLSMTIKNTSSTAVIKNLKVTVNGAAGSGEKGVAFSPANSSNSFFFDTLETGATRDISLDMLTRADAKPDSYPIEISFEYEYTIDGITDKATGIVETITIPVQQDDRFAINSIDVQPECYIGEEGYVSATFVNKGKSAVYNVEVEILGDGFTTTSSKLYIGNVESGNEEYFDTAIMPEFEGEITGTIIVRYEDSNGNEKELTQEFTTYAMQMFYEEPPMYDDTMGEMPGEEMPSGLPVWAIIAICVGGAGVVTAAVIIIVKVVKKKKAEAEDDDEDI